MSIPAHSESTLLLIDDDENVRFAYAAVLRSAGYRVVEAAGGREGLELAAREQPALILLDVEMPGLNGWQTLQELQGRPGRQPVMMITGEVAINDRVRGLSAGADDYLCKPCDARELLARVHALLRRFQPAPGPTLLWFGEACVNLAERTATRAGQKLRLTSTEFDLLDFLSRHAGRAVARATMLESVWGYADGASTRTVETHLWRLRGKLGDDGSNPRWIHTVPGFGYMLDRKVLTSGQPEALAIGV